MQFEHQRPVDATLFATLDAMQEASQAGAAVTAELEATMATVLLPRLDALTELLNAEAIGDRAIGRPFTVLNRDRLGQRAANRNRLDHSVRIVRGRWSNPGEVKVVVDLHPAGVEVFLTTWMAGGPETEAFTRWVRRTSMRLREDLLSASARLQQRHGVCIDLKYTSRADSVNPRARRWPEVEREWRVWTGNEQGQNSLGVFVGWPWNPEWVLELATTSDVRDPWEAAAKVVGGVEGRRLAALRADGVPDALASALDETSDRVAGHWAELVGVGGVTGLVVSAARELATLFERFRAAQDVPPRWRAPAPLPWGAKVPEIADTLAEAARRTGGLDQRPGPEGRALGVAGSGQTATVGWGTGRHLLRADVRRSRGEGPVAFSVRLGRLGSDMGEDRMLPLWRENLRAELDGPAGDDLLALARRTGNGLRFSCGRQACREDGGCHVHSLDDLLGHWLSSRDDPSLTWTISSPAGQADWVEAPAQLVAGLLSLAAWDPEPIAVPTVGALRWDVFVSTRSSVGPVSARLADALRDRGLATWHMFEHQYGGTAVRENMLGGLARSHVVVALLSEDYWRSRHCVDELSTALDQGRPVVPVLLAERPQTDRLPEHCAELQAHCKALKVSTDVSEQLEVMLSRIWSGDDIYVSIKDQGVLDAQKVTDIERQVRALLAGTGSPGL